VSVEPTAGASAAGEKGLKDGAIGLLSSVVIGISSTAPAYSLASALGVVVLAAGLQSPAIMILAFVPMFLVAMAYSQLNKEMPDCGTTFVWATKAFGPKTGWMGGWGIVAADVIVMANLGAIASQYTFEFFGADGLANSTFWQTFGGVVWIILMCAICYAGIEVSTRLQYGLMVVEIGMLIVFSITALVKVETNHALAYSIHPASSWFNPLDVHSFGALSDGILAAIFIYWGWDTAVSLNEETKDKDKLPGQAAVISTVVLLLTYVLVTTAAQAFAGIGVKADGLSNPGHSGDVLSILGKAVFGGSGFGYVLAKLLVLMVLSSSAASTLTTIMPTARTTLSMAAYRAIPSKFASISRRFLTPSWSTVGMGVVSIIFYVLMEKVSPNVLDDTIDALGLSIAFYYGLTGFACVWWYRKVLTRSRRDFFGKGVAPLLGGTLLLIFFVKACLDYYKASYGYTYWTVPGIHWVIGGTFITGVGSLLAGVILMIVCRVVIPAFFRGETLNKNTPILVPELDSVDLAHTLASEGILPADGAPAPTEEGSP
jgi:amino acid transporter